jgi:uncharacterized protein (DUF1810 family)
VNAGDTSNDPYNLARFLTAQAGSYPAAVAELRAGRKTSHWMWFVFPQLAGLGRSTTARFYGISSLDEARAYLADDLLGARLRETAGLIAATTGRTAEEIFGAIDALKLRSSMTLFHRADPDEPTFRAVLDRYYDARTDPATDELLADD